MSTDQLLWLTSRTAALTAFVVLLAAILTGQALRTSLLDGWVRKRAVADLHQFLTVCWLPLVAVHVAAVTLDAVSRLSWLDVLVPFRSSYAALPIGLGTCAFDLLIVVTVTSYLRDRISPPTWRWLHRLSYLMFALFGLHALLLARRGYSVLAVDSCQTLLSELDRQATGMPIRTAASTAWVRSRASSLS